MVKPDAIAGFTQASLEAGVPLTILNFPDAVHAFTNPNADAKAQEYPQLQGAIAYDEQATEISMMAMHAFFDATLRASE
jgi:dienelactone hydrolase